MAEELEQLFAQGTAGARECWGSLKPGRIDIAISAGGDWSYRGAPVAHERMRRFFASRLFVEEGVYYLASDWHKLRIEVEDVPFVLCSAEQRTGEAGGEWWFSSAEGEHCRLDAEHSMALRPYRGIELPYLHLRDGLWARVGRGVYYQLVDASRVEPVAQGARLWLDSAGQAFCLGELRDD